MRPFETGPEFSAWIQPGKALPRYVRRRKLLLNKDVRTKVKVRPFEAGGEFSAPRCGSARTLWTPLDLGGVPGIPEFLKHQPPPLTWEVWRCEDCNRTFEGERQPFPQRRFKSYHPHQEESSSPVQQRIEVPRALVWNRGVLQPGFDRSEERRVGKECRSRWSP